MAAPTTKATTVRPSTTKATPVEPSAAKAAAMETAAKAAPATGRVEAGRAPEPAAGKPTTKGAGRRE